MLNIISWSKNRACQLDLLLRSMWEYIEADTIRGMAMHVVFKATNQDFMDGYFRLMGKNYCPAMVAEEDFKKDVIRSLCPDNPYTMFLVDDNVFIDRFSLNCPEVEYLAAHPDDVVCVSTRMHPGITYSYSNGCPMLAPEFERDPLRWRWRGLLADWGYPMCAGDGQIYRTADILELLKSIDFSNPNNLEQQCSKKPIDRPYMVCFDKAKVLGVPNNKVQEWCENRHGNVSVERLNEQWLEGYRISLSNFVGINTNSPHLEMNYIIEKDS